MYCSQCFHYEKALFSQKENCITINGAQAIKMPKADDMVYFKNYHNGLAAPFIIYADFPAIMKRYTDVDQIMINHIPIPRGELPYVGYTGIYHRPGSIFHFQKSRTGPKF